VNRPAILRYLVSRVGQALGADSRLAQFTDAWIGK
jgi:hypothetical protein